MKNITRYLDTQISKLRKDNLKMGIEISKLKAEARTLQKAREREKYTLRQKQKNAQRLDIQIRKLRERERLLDALEAAGVDNWDGYEYAMELLQEGSK